MVTIKRKCIKCGEVVTIQTDNLEKFDPKTFVCLQEHEIQPEDETFLDKLMEITEWY